MNSSFYQSLEKGHFEDDLESTRLGKIKNNLYGMLFLIGKQSIGFLCSICHAAQVSQKPRHMMVLETNHTLTSFGLAGCLLNA